MTRVLILGGTAAALDLSEALVALNFTVITSLAGRTQQPRSPAGDLRIGSFGGVAGLVSYVQQERIDAVVDATHPFAAQMSEQAAIAAQTCAIPHLMLVRPAWEPEPGDRWLSVPTLQAAADNLPASAQRVFLTIGRREISTFAGKSDRWFLMRLLEPPPAETKLPPGTILYGRPPFTVEQERHWMQHYRIDTLVSKNSGGTATYAKIQAAQELGLPVVMVEQPPLPEGDRVATVPEAVQWVQRLVHSDVSLHSL